ncbi:hypothetical protein NDU88_004064, partial [Pleurodeles waltl]
MFDICGLRRMHVGSSVHVFCGSKSIKHLYIPRRLIVVYPGVACFLAYLWCAKCMRQLLALLSTKRDFISSGCQESAIRLKGESQYVLARL